MNELDRLLARKPVFRPASRYTGHKIFPCHIAPIKGQSAQMKIEAVVSLHTDLRVAEALERRLLRRIQTLRRYLGSRLERESARLDPDRLELERIQQKYRLAKLDVSLLRDRLAELEQAPGEYSGPRGQGLIGGDDQDNETRYRFTPNRG